MIAVIVIVVVIVVGLLVAVGLYNRLITLREQVKAAWAQIDVQLKWRHDLIPNLVETVKGYAKHEQGTLTEVVAARQAAVSTTPGDATQRAAAESALGASVGRLLAIAESYPDLKANQNFLQLQSQLATTENEISQSRQAYNALVATYNATGQSFPANLLAGAAGFVPQPFFEIKDTMEREVPVVKF